METPQVGIGATIQHYSDRTATTVIQVDLKLKFVVLQEDIAKRIDNNGMSESQEYEYKTNPDGKIYKASLRKDGSYRLVGSKEKVTFGVRDKYYDFFF